MTRRRRRTAALPLLAALAGCTGSDGFMVPRAPDFAVAPSLLTLSPGDTARLSAQLNLRPTGDVQFLSRGTSASVTAGGLVTALTPGIGAITAVATREGIIYTVPVTVRGVRVRLGARDLAAGAGTLPTGGRARLAATVFGLPRGSESGVRWASSDTAIAAVDADGTVRTRLLGRATLSATAVGDPFLHGTVVLDVTPGQHPAPVLRIAGITRVDSAEGAATTTAVNDSSAVAGTIAVSVQADPSAFPAGARAELSLGGRPVAVRPLNASSPLTFTIPTAARDSISATALYPDGPRSLMIRVLTPSGTLAGRVERAVVIDNS